MYLFVVARVHYSFSVSIVEVYSILCHLYVALDLDVFERRACTASFLLIGLLLVHFTGCSGGMFRRHHHIY
jgi:hypothetical protein